MAQDRDLEKKEREKMKQQKRKTGKMKLSVQIVFMQGPYLPTEGKVSHGRPEWISSEQC